MPVRVEGRRIEERWFFNSEEQQILGDLHYSSTPPQIRYQLGRETKISRTTFTEAWWPQAPLAITYRCITSFIPKDEAPVFDAVRIEAAKGQKEYHRAKEMSILKVEPEDLWPD